MQDCLGNRQALAPQAREATPVGTRPVARRNARKAKKAVRGG